MYYELYIDVFFLENLFVDSLLLLAVNYALKCGATYGRIFLGGVLGSGLTCLTVALPFPVPVKLFLFYLLISAVMLAAGLGLRRPGPLLKGGILLYLMAVLMGGIMQIFRPCMRYASLFYAAAGAGYLLLTRLWKFLGLTAGERERTVRVTIYRRDGSSLEAEALWDTGNSLRDYATGEPVSIAGRELAGRITSSPETERGFHFIPCRCVGGETLVKVFRIGRMCIHAGDGKRGEELWIREPVLGIAEEWSGGGPSGGETGYQLILNPELLFSEPGRPGNCPINMEEETR